MNYCYFDSFRRFTSLIFALLLLKSGRKKWVFVCLLWHMGTQATFAHDIKGAELFLSPISETLFKVSLKTFFSFHQKSSKGIQQFFAENTINQYSTSKTKFAPQICQKAFDNFAQTQRYTSIYFAGESCTIYNLVWAYQGLPAGLGNLHK
jgi:hypothetical protein